MFTSLLRSSARAVCLQAMIALAALAAAGSAHAQVVISAFYPNTGSASAGYNGNFIELYNQGISPVNLSTYTVQYAAATGNSWSSRTLSGTIQPRSFFLVRLNTSNQNSAGFSIPTPDFTVSSNLGPQAAAGKIALFSTSSSSTLSCPSTTNLVDFIGYGTTADCRSPITGGVLANNAPAPSGTTLLVRTNINQSVNPNTNSNAADFTAVSCASYNPRNSQTAANIDGFAFESAYGNPIASQSVQTQFGNNTLGIADFADGSELNTAYGYISNNTLYLTLTGNLQTNNNRLYIFLDSVAGGQNRIRGDNPMPLQRWGDCSGTNGMQFDAGFDADYWYAINLNGGTFQMFVDGGSMPTSSAGTSTFIGSTTSAGGNGGVLSGGTNPDGIRATINNSNNLGVAACTCPCGPSSPAGVLSGVEMAIPLSAIGAPSGPVKVMAIIANSDVNNPFLSNQVLGAVPNNYCNLGDPRGTCGSGAPARNFASDPGDQFFTVGSGAPTISTHPIASTSICSGGTVALSVVASGANLVYQWQASTNGGSSWSAANGTGANTANFTSGTLTSDTLFRCLVLNGVGSVISSSTTVTINPLPSTPTGTASYVGSIGSPITMTVTTGVGVTADWLTGTCSGGTVVSGGSGTLSLTVTPTAIGTTTYNVRARNSTSGCTSTSCLTVTLSVPPANDDCANAIPISGPYTGSGVSVTGSLVGALSEGSQFGTTCSGGSGTMGTKAGVWYTFTGTGTQVRVDLCSTTPVFDSVLYVMCGSCSGLSCVGSNDDSTANSCSGNLSNVTVSTSLGTTYYVWVGPFSAVPTTNFTLRITDTTTANGTLVACVPSCMLTPPSGATAEVEPCTVTGNAGTGSNSGCDGTLASQPPQALGSISTTADVTGQARANTFTGATTFYADVDWYTFSIPASNTVLVTGQVQFPANVSIRDLGVSPGSCTGATTIGTAQTPAACGTFSMSGPLVAGRTYAIRIANTATSSTAYGCSGSNYFFTIQVGVPTPPSGTGALNATLVAQGCETLITVTPTPGSNPASLAYGVSANLTAIGGSSTQPLFDNGTSGDAVSGDGIFSYRATIAGNTTTGSKTLSFTVTDDQLRTSGPINLPALTVNNYYTVTPTSTGGLAGNTVTLSSTVTQASASGTGNTCTVPSGTAVSIDLSTIGGGSSVAMTEGPAGTWTVSYAIPGAQANGAYTLPIALSDGQGRSATANLAFSVGYCAAGSNACGTGDERISNVVFNTIANSQSTGAGPTGCYQDFTAQSTSVNRSFTYPITVTNAGPFTGDLCSVYVDWNQNGVFTDSGETTALTGSGTSNAQTFSGNITVPAGATLGATRMRIRLSYTSGQTSCGNASFGEVEDYTVTVTQPAYTVALVANPTTVPQGCSTDLTATVTGTYSAPITVTVNLSSIGGGTAVPMVETPANSGIFVLSAPVPAATTTGNKNITVSTLDAVSIAGSAGTSITVSSGALTATSNSPIGGAPSATACLQVTVSTPACLPLALGTTVVANLSALGGSASFPLTDDGSSPGCDDVAGDLIYGTSLTLPTTLGTFTVPVTITEPGVGGRTASTTLSVSVRPPNDECTGAIPLLAGTTSNLSIAGASTSLPTWGCVSSSAQNDVWFSFTACASGNVVIDTCGSRASDGGSGIDTVLQVFTGTCGSLTSQGCNDDHLSTITGCTANTADSRVSFTADAGTTYLFRVARYSTTGNDKFVVRISAPSVSDPTSPSSDPTICAGSPATVSATVGSGGDTIDWFTDSCGGTLAGSGPSLVVSPTVTTTYFGRTRNSASNCSSAGCVSVTVNVTPAPTADAGSGSSVCEGGTVTLGGSASNFTAVAWSGGTGTFTSSNTLATNYILGPGDTGSVVLTLTATGTAPCTTAVSNVTITVNPLPSAPTLSSDVSICSGSGTTLSATAGLGETVEWFTGSCGGTPAGTGSSLNVSPTTTTTYYARAVSANNCPSATCAQVTVTVVEEPTAVAGSNLTISACTGLPLPLNGVVTDASSVLWTTSGSGTFASATSAATTYTFSAADRLASSIQLTLTAQPTAPCATPAVSTLTVNITPPPATAYVDDNYVGLPYGTSVNFPFDGQPGPYTIGCDAFASVQAGVNAVVASTVIIAPGTYVGDITITLNNLNLLSSGGAGVTTLVGSKGDSTGATIRINANNVTVAGFTITREGNNVADWNDANGALNSAGIAIQGAFSGATIRDNIITGNRSGIDINNSSGHTVRNNEIIDNRTGVIFRNQTDNITFTENNVSDNWTVGILFLDASSGTNIPVQSAANCNFSGNKFSGNWYGQIVDRQSGGSLPAPGSNVKNFSRNSFGTTSPVISTANSTEPGYSSQIPMAFGGTAVPPGGQPDVLGTASANFDITPYLNVATDTNINYGSGTFGFQGDFSNLTVTSALAQSGSTGRIQEGHDAVDSGGSVAVTAGAFTENLAISKLLTIDGAGSGDCASGADPMTQTVVTAVNTGLPTVTINDVGGASALSRLTLKDIRVTGSTVAGVQLTSIAVRSFFLFDNLAVTNNGGTGLEFVGTSGFSDAQILDSSFCANYTGIRTATSLASFDGLLVDGCEILNSTFNGLAMHGQNANAGFSPTNITVSNSSFAANGQSSDLFQGSGDISFFNFNGNASISNVNVATTGRVPVQFRGRGTDNFSVAWQPAGTITLSGVTVTGTSDRSGIYMHYYADVNNVSLNNVDLSGLTSSATANTAFAVSGMTLVHLGATPLNLGNTSFPCQGPGYVGLAVFGSGGASASCSTVFSGATTLTQKETCVFDVDDFAGVGQVTFLDGEITDQPDPLAVCLGSAANFSVTAIGNVTGYQWLLDGNPILGANSASYNIPAVGLADLGAYSVEVITGCGTLTSTTAALTANPATVASINEASLSVCQGGSATFTTTASGFGMLTYQWLKDSNPIIGANNPSLTINPAALADAGNYSVVVTGGCGSVTTSASALTVETGPSIDTPPASVVACNGQSVTFTVAASGSAPITYQWRKNTIDIGGANSASFTIPSASAGDVGNYDCVVTNSCGSTTTSAASLSIAPTPSVVYVDDGYIGLPIGTPVNFPHDGGSGPYSIGCNAFATIQGGVDNVLNNGTVNVAAGSYPEFAVNGRSGIKVYGAGAASTSVIGAHNSGTAYTIQVISSPNTEIAGFTITRSGNNPGDWSANVKSYGLLASSNSGLAVYNNIVTGNRNGIYLENNSNAVVRNNVIDNNRTGMHLVAANTNSQIVQNVVTNNWTMGILFRTESVSNDTAGTLFSNNNISDNWYAQIEYREDFTALSKDFSANWLGTTSPVISNVSGGEPGYASQIPVVFGGTATAPGGQPDVKGNASSAFDITPYLNVATDTDVSTGFGTFGFQGDYSALTVTSSLAQTGSTGRIQEGVDLATTGGTVNVLAGTFSGVTEVDKSVTLLGANAGVCSTATRGTETIVRPATSQALDGILFYLTASNITIDGFTLTGDNGASGDGQILATGEADVGNIISNGSFDNITTYPFVHVKNIEIVNNFILAANDVAVNLYNDGSFPVSDNNDISCNTFTNLAGQNTISSGGPYNRITVLLYNDTYANIDDNVIGTAASPVNIGVQTGNNFRAATNPANATMNDNNIVSETVGLFHNLHYANASPWTISNNTVTSAASSTVNTGIVAWSLYSGATATLTNNTVTNCDVGYEFWNNPVVPSITMSGGSITGCNVGALFTNFSTYGAGAATETILNNVSITSAPGGIGLRVNDDAAPAAVDAITAIVNNSNVSGQFSGASVTGPFAGLMVTGGALASNGTGASIAEGVALFQGVNLTGNSANGVTISGGAIVDLGQCGTGTDVTGLGISSGNNNLTGYGFDAAAPFAIANSNSSSEPNVLAFNNNFTAGGTLDVELVLSNNSNAALSAILYSDSSGPSIFTQPAGGAFCPGTPVNLSVVAYNAVSYQWYFGANPVGTNSPSYSIPALSPAEVGNYTVVVTDACGLTVTSLIAAIGLLPVPADPTSASADTTLYCSDSAPANITLSALGGSGTTLEWSTSCGGSSIGTGSPLTIAAPTSTTTYFARWVNSCGASNCVSVTINVTDAPIVSAGSGSTICATDDASLVGTATNAASVLWTGGTGVFSSPTTLATTYTPGIGETGSVVLTLTATGNAPCASASSTVTINISPAPTASAGSNISSCYTVPVLLNGSATNASSTLWSTSGSGTFSSASSLATSYFPSPADITAGTVTLTLTAQPVAPCSTPAVSSLVLTLTPQPTATYSDDGYVGLPNGTSVDFPYTGGSGPFIIGCDAFATIQGAVNAVTSTGTVSVAVGNYVEDVLVNKSIAVLGGFGGTSTVSGAIGGQGSTFRLDASNVTLAGFTITREGNNTTDWTNPNLNSAGIAIQGAFTGNLIRDNIITGNRSAIDINNSSGHTLRNNDITNNHTGVIFRNQTDNITFIENAVTNNRTVGILFLDASGGSNSPVQTAANCTFANNNLSGNWYGQIEDRQIGGSLPAPGSNLKNFSGNWLGTTSPVISNVTGGEPGYASHIPVVFGGTATPPGGQPDVKGAASANFDITPYLNVATDTNVSTGFGTFGFQGDYSALTVTSSLAQTGSSGRIQEGHDLVTAAGDVNVTPGTFAENTVITKHVKITGSGSGGGGASGNPATDTIVSPSSGIAFLIDDVGGASAANRLAINNLRIQGGTTGVKLQVANAQTRSFFGFNNLAAISVTDKGIAFDPKTSGGGLTDVLVENSFFNFGGNIGIGTAAVPPPALAQLDGVTIDNCEFKNNFSVGVYIGGQDGVFSPTNITVSNSTFVDNGTSTIAGTGHLHFFWFNGNASLSNLSLSMTGTNVTRQPLQFRGWGSASTATWQPLGTVSLNNVDISGRANRPGIYIQRYASLAGLSLNGVDLSGMISTNGINSFAVGMQVSHIGAPFALNDTIFPCQGPGYFGLTMESTGGASASCATVFTGATTLSQKEACVADFNDVPSLGDVTFLDAEITDQPDPVSVCLGTPAAFSVTASGPGLTYQWYLDGNPILGANNSTYNIASVGFADAGNYTVDVISACGTITSTSASLAIIPGPVAATSASASIPTYCLDSVPPSITLSALGGSGLTFNWTAGSCGGTVIGSGTSISIPAPLVTTTYFGYWTNTCGNSTCVSVTVTPVAAPTANAGGTYVICADGVASVLGSATSASSTMWTTSGDGIFIDPTALSTVYIPGTNDISLGSATLTLTANPNAPCATAAVSNTTLTINPLPVAPASLATSHDNFCAGSVASINLSATGGSGAKLTWFANTCGGAPIGSGPAISIAAPSVTTTYFARWVNSCGTSACASVTVNVNPLPATPSVGSDSAICAGEGFTLTGSVPSGITIDWFEGSCGGTLVGSGTSLPVSPAATTTYFARARNSTTGCISTACATLTVTVNPLPATPVAGSGGTICDGESFTLTATVGSGETVDWFTGSCGGTPVGSGASLPVSPITTTTYFARARNTTTSCVSAACATVTVTVNPLPATPVAGSGGAICDGESFTLTATVGSGETVDWFTGSCGGTLVGSGTSLSVSPTSTTTYFARARNTTTSCVSTACASVTVTVNPLPVAPTVGAGGDICDGGTFTLTGSVPSGFDIDWYDGSCGGTLVGSGSSLPVSPTVTTTYYARARNTSTSCVSTTCATVTVNVNPLPATPVAGSGGSICSGEPFTLTATVGSGEDVEWFTGSCGSTPAGSGTSLSVSPLVTTTYYARAKNTTTNCVSAACASVTVNVTTTPTSPTAANVDVTQFCTGSAPATITLSATGGSGGVYTWYSGSCGSTPVGTGSPLTIAAPSSTTTYFVRREDGVCFSASCQSVTVTVDASPVAPASAGVDSPTFCSGTLPTITLSATGGSGDVLKWYSSSCGSTPVGTGSPLTIAAPLTSTTYFARWETTACGNSACASVAVTVNASPVAPTSITTSSNNYCAGSVTTLTLTAVGGSGDSIQWFSGSCGSTPIGSGPSITIAAPVTTTTYFARWSTVLCGNSNCASATVTVNPITGACCTGFGNAKICTVVDPINCIGLATPTQAYRGNCTTCSPTRCCGADYNNNGTIEINDIFDFLNAWFAFVPSSDFNNSGTLSIQDIFDFLNAWFAGC